MPTGLDRENGFYAYNADRVIVAGDAPLSIKDRYRIVDHGQDGFGFYGLGPAGQLKFQDRGDDLVAAGAHPETIRDMVFTAHHRGWTTLGIRGDEDFRRRTWMTAAAMGMITQGYIGRDGDLLAQALWADRLSASPEYGAFHAARDEGRQGWALARAEEVNRRWGMVQKSMEARGLNERQRNVVMDAFLKQTAHVYLYTDKPELDATANQPGPPLKERALQR